MIRRTPRRPRAGARHPPDASHRLVACPFCGREVPFAWTCRHCGFKICQRCMQDNIQLFTCNHITWWCPDCGESNGFGNQ